MHYVPVPKGLKPFLQRTISGFSLQRSGRKECGCWKESSPVFSQTRGACERELEVRWWKSVVRGEGEEGKKGGESPRLKMVYRGATIVTSPGTNRPQMTAPSLGVFLIPPVGRAGCSLSVSFTTPFRYGSCCSAVSSEQSSTVASSAYRRSATVGLVARR